MRSFSDILREAADYRHTFKPILDSFTGVNNEFSVLKKPRVSRQVSDVTAIPKQVKSDANRGASASGASSDSQRKPNASVPNGTLRRSARLRATN